MTDQPFRTTTYNMRQGGSGDHWARILSATRPDLLLVQETKDPRDFGDSLFAPLDLRGAIWSATDGKKWGSALFVPGGSVREIRVPGFEGWVTGGEVHIREMSLMVFSVHVPGADGSYVKTGHRIMDALEKVIDGRTCVIGGDWNFTPCLRDPIDPTKNLSGEPEFVQQMRDRFDLRSAWRAAHPTGVLPQTLRWMREPTAPYHCDGIFASASLVGERVGARVIDGHPWTAMSDHNPVAVEWWRGGD